MASQENYPMSQQQQQQQCQTYQNLQVGPNTRHRSPDFLELQLNKHKIGTYYLRLKIVKRDPLGYVKLQFVAQLKGDPWEILRKF